MSDIEGAASKIQQVLSNSGLQGERLISEDGLINSKLKILSPEIYKEIEKIFGKLAIGLGECSRELDKLIKRIQENPCLQEEFTPKPVSQGFLMTKSPLACDNNSKPPWSHRKEEAISKLPSGLGQSKRFGRSPRKADPGKRGLGRYSGRK